MKDITFMITENTEPVNALEIIKLFVNRLEEDLYSWKWIIIAAHNCTQSFMVSALRSGTNLNVLENQSANNWFNEFTKRMKAKVEDWKSPREKLDYFMSLYKKIKSDRMLFLTVSKKLDGDENKDEAMKWLHYHRNMFIHFVPSTFEMNVIHFPKRMLIIMEIIKFSESGNILWLNTEDKEISVALINELIERFKDLNNNYTSNKTST